MKRRVLPLALMALAACKDPEIIIGASLASPMGLAVANDYLFVANHDEDALQVLDVRGGLASLRFVESPSRYFPVRIPSASGPTELAATADGRFVVVLNAYSEALRLIDAGSERPSTPTLVRALPSDAESPIVEVPVGPAGSRPTALVASPAPCELADCAGRVFVALAGQGVVVAFVVLAPAGAAPRLEVERVYAVGGEPARLSVSPDGLLLFATDIAAPYLLRIDRKSGAVERRDLGDAGGPLAVSQDGKLVIVGRPVLRDVVVFTDASSAAWDLKDADAAFAPVPDPACLQPCGEADRCAIELEHPADRSLCIDGAGGLAATSELYRAIYLDRVPAHIATLGVSAGHQPLTVSCPNVKFDEFALVAGLDGHLRMVGLLGSGSTVPAPSLASSGACVNATVSPERFEVDVATNVATRPAVDSAKVPIIETLGTLLEPCPTTPARARFTCLTDGTGGVVLSPGVTGNLAWELRWEGVLVSRNPGAGDFPCRTGATDTCGTATTRFTDLAVDLGAFAIREDDILEILTPPTCTLDTLCSYERRILAVDRSGDRAVIELKEPLDPSCFRGGGVIDYRIRVGDQFLAVSSRVSRGSVRVKPGQVFGPGGDVGRNQGELFRLKSLANAPGVAACDRYEANGSVLPEAATTQDPFLARNRAYRITLGDARVPFDAAFAFDQFGGRLGPAGRLPAGLLVYTPPTGSAIAFVSYSATDGLLGFFPFTFDADHPNGTGGYAIVQ